MDGGGASGGGPGGGPAPFLIKTYEMVDDMNTDSIVSWSSTKKSFVVWNPPEFQRVLLPSYFKHNNFSSFIRQLNTYGFRKVDPERWEFANDDFIKDQKHLLKNIHRRKPIHSHSQPPSPADPERASYEEEIDRLSREKVHLEGNISGFKEQQSAARAQLETLTQRINSMEQKHKQLLSYVEKALKNPNFVEQLARKLDSMDFSAYSKKRRLPASNHPVQTAHDSVPLDSQSSCSRPEACRQDLDLCNALRLELSPAVSDVNLLSHSTQSSNEEVNVRASGLELSDTGASFTLKMDSLSFRSGLGSPTLLSLNCNNMSLNDADGDQDANLSCLLNLSLASSSPLELNNKSQKSVGENNEVRDRALLKDATLGAVDGGRDLSSARDANNKKVGPAMVNDVFWEQFLTERPGCADNEEARNA
ncbi:Heat stress transcription factor A-5 [Striga hermonthica]|uniref:Heat stress transcription factor n=1 Tax=Striga hermonthica TaxID=68872 RepID=A0A9N7RAL3_STRHE|nr:Heat stress transcription factor A-5 [Striga hermonthica]